MSYDDCEVHSFEDMETDPPVDIDECDRDVRVVVEEMKRFKADFVEVAKGGNGASDLRQFWLRKTKKPVLAVLLARGPDGGDRIYRGTNMEVSMPTGSLCAERNVIGTALAENVGMKRGDLVAVAVLAVDLDKEGDPVLCVEVNAEEEVPDLFATKGEPPPSPKRSQTPSPDRRPATPPVSPLRRISLRKYSDSDVTSPSQKPRRARRARPTKTITTDGRGLNPLKPCGACNEVSGGESRSIELRRCDKSLVSHTVDSISLGTRFAFRSG